MVTPCERVVVSVEHDEHAPKLLVDPFIDRAGDPVPPGEVSAMQPPSSTITRLVSAAALICVAVLSFAAGRAVASSPVLPSAGTMPSAGGAPTADTVAAAPKCATSGLVVWLGSGPSGTAGSFYYSLDLTNLSGRRCTLSGYPGVSGVNLAGTQVGSAASRDTTTTPHLVTLAAGASAVAVLRIVDVNNFPSAKCRKTTAAGLRVYPPNQTASKVVPFPFPACSRSGPVYLSAGAVTHA